MERKSSVVRVALSVGMVVLIVALLGGLLYLGELQTQNRLNQAKMVEENVAIATESIGAIESNLSKLLVSADKDESVLLLLDTSFQTRSVLRSIDNLPMSNDERQTATKFLNRIADFCLACAKNPQVDSHKDCQKLFHSVSVLNQNIADLGAMVGKNHTLKDGILPPIFARLEAGDAEDFGNDFGYNGENLTNNLGNDLGSDFGYNGESLTNNLGSNGESLGEITHKSLEHLEVISENQAIEIAQIILLMSGRI